MTDETPSPCDQIDAVTPASVRRFAVTVGLESFDARPGADAPFGLHWCLAPDAAPLADLADDGLARTPGAILPPPPGYRHTMWAGADVEIRAPLRVGDLVRRRTRVLDLVEKVGRSGPLAFGRVEQVFSVAGEDRVIDEQRYVFRRDRVEPTAGAAEAAATVRGEILGRFATDPITLFRFSALTFNAHRIHVDRAYAIDVEGFVERLVHGTLTAAVLANAATARFGGAAIAGFAFRARAPAFCGETLVLSLGSSAAGAEVAARTEAGRTVMTAAVRVR